MSVSADMPWLLWADWHTAMQISVTASMTQNATSKKGDSTFTTIVFCLFCMGRL